MFGVSYSPLLHRHPTNPMNRGRAPKTSAGRRSAVARGRGGKKGHFRSRSEAVHRSQAFLAVWDNDAPPDQAVDTSLFSGTTSSDFYDDAGENYENLEDPIIPFSNLPDEIRKEYGDRMQELEKDMKERDRVPPEVMKAIDPKKLPIRLNDGHRHDRITIAVHASVRIERTEKMQEDRNVYDASDSDGESSGTEPYAESSDACMHLLDERCILFLVNLGRYDSWETFILPKLHLTRRSQVPYRSTIGKFCDDAFKYARLEVAGVQLKTCEEEVGEGVEAPKILVPIRLDDRDLFYVCAVFNTIEEENRIPASLRTNKNKTVLLDEDYSGEDEKQKRELELVRNVRLIFRTYFYFTCGCEK